MVIVLLVVVDLPRIVNLTRVVILLVGNDVDRVLDVDLPSIKNL